MYHLEYVYVDFNEDSTFLKILREIYKIIKKFFLSNSIYLFFKQKLVKKCELLIFFKPSINNIKFEVL